MATKITQEQIQQMINLYATIGTYSGVAKQMGISPSTVSRYLKTQPVKSNYETVLAAKPIEEITPEEIKTFATLTEEEQRSFNAWLMEFKR